MTDFSEFCTAHKALGDIHNDTMTSGVSGKRATKPYECRCHRTSGPNSRRERWGLCENLWAFLCQPGTKKVFFSCLGWLVWMCQIMRRTMCGYTTGYRIMTIIFWQSQLKSSSQRVQPYPGSSSADGVCSVVLEMDLCVKSWFSDLSPWQQVTLSLADNHSCYRLVESSRSCT